MRIPLVAGNWKMNKTVAEARELAFSMILKLRDIGGVEKVICPPSSSLLVVSALLKGTDIELGAQNMHWEAKGAYTGELSPPMVAEFCRFVIIGHSERRAYFFETNETVNKKVHSAMKHKLTPIVCVGETQAKKEAGQTAEVVGQQVRLGLEGLEKELAAGIVIAYEPVWAIGTGQAATAEGASKVIAGVIKPVLIEMFGESLAGRVRVLYGGSVNSANAAEFFSNPEIDGALVGGASLSSDEFIAITRSAVG